MSTQREKVPVKIADVLKMLSEGKDRKEIGAHYGLRPVEITELFRHPELKGKKVKTPLSFVIVPDDAPVASATVSDTPVANEVVVEIPNTPVAPTSTPVEAPEVTEQGAPIVTEAPVTAQETPVETNQGLW